MSTCTLLDVVKSIVFTFCQVTTGLINMNNKYCSFFFKPHQACCDYIFVQNVQLLLHENKKINIKKNPCSESMRHYLFIYWGYTKFKLEGKKLPGQISNKVLFESVVFNKYCCCFKWIIDFLRSACIFCHFKPLTSEITPATLK